MAGDPYVTLAMRCLESRPNHAYFLIRQYSEISGEAVRDSRIVVADQGDALSAIDS